MAIEPLHNERELLHRLSYGDETAFTLLFRHYHEQLLRVVFLFVRSRSIAEETIQEIFLKVWTGREKLRDIQDFRSWLFIITRNYIINYLKKMANEKAVRLAWTAEIPFSGNDADYGIRTRQMTGLLEQAIHYLPAQQQKVFRLAREEYLTYDQIAKKLNLSPHTVRTHMSKALENIRHFFLLNDASLLLILSLPVVL